MGEGGLLGEEHRFVARAAGRGERTQDLGISGGQPLGEQTGRWRRSWHRRPEARLWRPVRFGREALGPFARWGWAGLGLLRSLRGAGLRLRLCGALGRGRLGSGRPVRLRALSIRVPCWVASGQGPVGAVALLPGAIAALAGVGGRDAGERQQTGGAVGGIGGAQMYGFRGGRGRRQLRPGVGLAAAIPANCLPSGPWPRRSVTRRPRPPAVAVHRGWTRRPGAAQIFGVGEPDLVLGLIADGRTVPLRPGSSRGPSPRTSMHWPSEVIFSLWTRSAAARTTGAMSGETATSSRTADSSQERPNEAVRC